MMRSISILSLMLSLLIRLGAQPPLQLGETDISFKEYAANPMGYLRADASSRLHFIKSGQKNASSFSQLIPDFVKDNPRGYSYLCRLELKIEEKLPVGIWVKVGEEPSFKGDFKSNAHLRFKLFNF